LYPKPEQLHEWGTFHDDGVVNHAPPSFALDGFGSTYHLLFKKRLIASERKAYNSEKGEEKYLLGLLTDTLVESRIVEKIETKDETRGLHGKADFTLWVKQEGKKKPKLAVIGESKSTHNLLLPNTATDLVRKYKEAYQTLVQNGNKRTTEWSHIAHPLAQIVGYMIDNKQRYGSLTSATRTYFIFLEGNGVDMSVRVSDPYFLGEPTYLRAWSYIVSLGAAQRGKFVAPSGWLKISSDDQTLRPSPDSTGSEPQKRSTTKDTKKRGRGNSADSKGNVSTKPSKRARPTGPSLELTHVPFKDLMICAEIGFGRNGTVFQVQWKNQRFALKQFDLRKGGYDAFHKELAAYALLKDAWSRLVPEPMFVSESPSGAIRYLGLELGRDPSGSDYYSMEWSSVLHSLKTEYGMRLPDSINSNGLILTKDGQDRLVAMDLEEWSLCPIQGERTAPEP